MANRSTFNVDFFLNLHLILKIKNAIPDYQVNSLLDIHGILVHTDIEAIILDIDQTVVPYGTTRVSEEIHDSIRSLKPHYRMCFLSNFPHTEDRVKRIRTLEKHTGIDAIFSKRRKPSPAAFQLALQYLKSAPEETMMVGDRILTDIIGANKLGIKTVLVAPLDKKTDPFFMVTLPRFFERPYLKLGRLVHRQKP
jgi:HAD superfamily phosphatase (TIGR01668 family)